MVQDLIGKLLGEIQITRVAKLTGLSFLYVATPNVINAQEQLILSLSQQPVCGDSFDDFESA